MSISCKPIFSHLILLVFTMHFLTAQKVVKKSIVDSTITSFQIDASKCFKVQLRTTGTDTIQVEAIIDGEYRKDLVMNVEEVGTTTLVSVGFRPNFENPNDKLSAHKVISIALEISVPAYKTVRVFGTNANIRASGTYQELKITLNDGASNLVNVHGNVAVTSQSGDILVENTSGEILANSKYGVVGENQIPMGDTKYLLNTVTGNIHFKRIE